MSEEKSRPSRAEETQTRRRRRQTNATGGRLEISQKVKDENPDMEFRWATNDEGRMDQLTKNDDWTPVPKVDHFHAGTGKSGDSIQHILVMKPKAMMDEDRAAMRARIDAVQAGQLAKPGIKEAEARGAAEYAVEGNKI